MIAEGPALAKLLPQQAPFVMIGQLLLADAQRTVSRFRVEASSVLFSDGVFSEAGLIENIAQTAAAGVGYHHQRMQQAAPIGYIAAIKSLKIGRLPVAGAELTTEVEIKNQVLDFTIVQGSVYADNELIAECEMRIFLKN